MSLLKQLHIFGAVLSLLLLGSCGKTYDPNAPENRPCLEQLKVFDVKGQKAWKTIGGQYIKVGSIGPYCGKIDPNAKLNEYITHGGTGWSWFRGVLYDDVRKIHHYLPKDKDGFPDTSKIGSVHVAFRNLTVNNSVVRSATAPDWWFSPALPHKLYPIDLLPNFGLKEPDSRAGIDPVKTQPTLYWAVRGTKDLLNGRPFINFHCDTIPPASAKDGDLWWQRDPLIAITLPVKPMRTGNTCRGYINASNGTISGMIDTPGILLPEIDKVFNAVSIKLSDIVIEE